VTFPLAILNTPLKKGGTLSASSQSVGSRTAGLCTAKLICKHVMQCGKPFFAGCNVTVVLNSAYNVAPWSGEKKLFLAPDKWSGSERNLLLPILFLASAGVGTLSAFAILLISAFKRL
jgi:hypothetical protein